MTDNDDEGRIHRGLKGVYFDLSVDEGFVRPVHRESLLVCERPDDLIDQLEAAS